MPVPDEATIASNPVHEHGFLWRACIFVLNLIAAYVMVNTCTPWLAGLTRGTILPFLQMPVTSSARELLFNHLLVFSVIPAFLAGLFTLGFKQKSAYFIWIVPALVLTYKVTTSPVSTSVLPGQPSFFTQVWHRYFAGGFLLPDFRSWDEFWDIVRSNSDFLRAADQFRYTAPLYAATAYSLGAWAGMRADLTRRIEERLKLWEDAKFQDKAGDTRDDTTRTEDQT